MGYTQPFGSYELWSGLLSNDQIGLSSSLIPPTKMLHRYLFVKKVNSSLFPIESVQGESNLYLISNEYVLPIQFSVSLTDSQAKFKRIAWDH